MCGFANSMLQSIEGVKESGVEKLWILIFMHFFSKYPSLNSELFRNFAPRKENQKSLELIYVSHLRRI